MADPASGKAGSANFKLQLNDIPIASITSKLKVSKYSRFYKDWLLWLL
ncbi:MAG: hypothetical protein JXA17_01220 [Dehalococcoidales bacterium]|nr:hypothetical protein [Dehalococcoidales bacterium]